MIKFVTTFYLTDDGKNIREEVFVKEQKFVKEFDDIDNSALHIVMYDDSKAVACCRIYMGEGKDEYIAGRIAVIKEYRGKHFGQMIMSKIDETVKMLGGTKISLSAQVRAKGFYQALGYNQSGDIYYDEYCEHIHMEKSL